MKRTGGVWRLTAREVRDRAKAFGLVSRPGGRFRIVFFMGDEPVAEWNAKPLRMKFLPDMRSFSATFELLNAEGFQNVLVDGVYFFSLRAFRVPIMDFFLDLLPAQVGWKCLSLVEREVEKDRLAKAGETEPWLLKQKRRDLAVGLSHTAKPRRPRAEKAFEVKPVG